MASPAKTVKRIRLSVCVLYIAEIFFLTETFFVMDFNGDNKLDHWSILYTFYNSVSVGVFNLAAVTLAIALIPVAGFFFFSFDKSRNIKNIYGVLTSAVAVFLIIAVVPAESLGIGAVLSLLCYLPIVFLSVLGMFARKNQVAAQNYR